MNTNELTTLTYILFNNTRVGSKIMDNLYIGNALTSRNKKYLIEIGVTHIIRIGRRLRDYFPDKFSYMCISIEDSVEENISVFFESTYNFISNCIEKGGSVFIHCQAGASRSCTIAIAYIMRKFLIPFSEAFAKVKLCRIIAQPNQGFIFELREYYLKVISKLIGSKKNLNDGMSSRFFCNKLKKPYSILYKHPHLKKPKTVKINKKKQSRKLSSIDFQKVKLFSILDNKTMKIKKESLENIEEKLMKMIKTPMTIINKYYQNEISTKASYQQIKLIKKRISNMILREGKKYIFHIIRSIENQEILSLSK